MLEESAVSLKLPIFWTSEVHVWFAQAEVYFNIRKITANKTKYYYVLYVLSALDQGTATHLLNLINRPPPENKYTALKDRLINTWPQ